ncbi:hypothetical protein [Pseudaminobacter soli (ex Li et al. 2025)]|uniref:DUF3828 domain-containing protein n=1 Tax=Pseudaminobacter soli (ex Li et al. 2025) TaxID=1295366 RepID=A0A2P7SFV3_9HYPH|nr:hypothetical protein [Mesorhizobium soli]PSJ61379.1 hypothetical protein C7I85_09945 [Mesorhizobium soli]
MRLNAIFLAMCFTVGGLSNALAAQTATELAKAFCQTRVEDNAAGTRNLLTPSLRDAVAEAENRNDAIAKANPDDKPPFGDGIPYQTYPDLAPVCEPGTVTDTDGRTLVEVSYKFPQTPEAGWTDRIAVLSTPEGWLIDDVLYEAPADQTEALTLRMVLESAFDD